MQDRVSLYPGRVKLVPVAGQENTYDMVRADSPTQDGTPLNKDSLLKDATASLFGLTADAVPDDVFLDLFNKNTELSNYAKRIASDSSGIQKTLDYTGSNFTVTKSSTNKLNLVNNLSGDEEIVYISKFGITNKSGSGNTSSFTYHSKISLVINGVEYFLIDKDYTQVGTKAFADITDLTGLSINLMSVIGRTIKAGDTVALKISHTAVSGNGSTSAELSAFSLDVRVV